MFLRGLAEDDRAELLALGFSLPPSDREIKAHNRKINATHREGDRAATEAKNLQKRIDDLAAETREVVAQKEALDAKAAADRAT